MHVIAPHLPGGKAVSPAEQGSSWLPTPSLARPLFPSMTEYCASLSSPRVDVANNAATGESTPIMNGRSDSNRFSTRAADISSLKLMLPSGCPSVTSPVAEAQLMRTPSTGRSNTEGRTPGYDLLRLNGASCTQVGMPSSLGGGAAMATAAVPAPLPRTIMGIWGRATGTASPPQLARGSAEASGGRGAKLLTGHASVARRAPSLRRQAALSSLHTATGSPAVRADVAGTASAPCPSSDALMVAATCAQGPGCAEH